MPIELSPQIKLGMLQEMMINGRKEEYPLMMYLTAAQRSQDALREDTKEYKEGKNGEPPAKTHSASWFRLKEKIEDFESKLAEITATFLAWEAEERALNEQIAAAAKPKAAVNPNGKVKEEIANA